MFKIKLIYLCSLILMGAIAILYNVYYTGILFIVWLVLPTILFIILVIIWKNVKVNLVTNSSVSIKDELFYINIKIRNKSLFPVSRMDILLVYGNQYGKEIKKENIQVSMDKLCMQEVSTRVSSSYCGNLTFQLKSIKIYDYFHMFTLTKKLNKSINITILPIYHPIEDFIMENVTFLNEGNEFSPYKSGDDPSEVFQIREYREGDKSSRLHRKLSYKHNEMMMKEYSYPINTKLLLLFDLYCGQDKGNKLEVVDSLLQVLMSVSMIGIENSYKQSVFYKTNDKHCMEKWISNESGLYELFENLYVLDIPEYFNSVVSLHMEYDINTAFSHMILISYSIDVEGIIKWLNLHQDTLVTIMYVNYLDTNPIDENDKLLLESLLINIFEIDIKNINTNLDTLIL